MKKLATALSVFAISAFVAGASASAAQRVDTQDLTTTQVKQLIQEHGSAVLSTGAGVFDRYVANGSYCYTGDEAKPAYVPTSDASSSFVGYTCAPINGDNS
nr:hypothetical protein [uncultured Cohaesibacter sp.]